MQQQTTENQTTDTKKWDMRELFLAYLPAILSAICNIVTTILYSIPSITPYTHWTVYFDQVFMAVVQFAIVFINRKFKLGLPYYLIALMALHSVFSVDMGTSLGFYGRWKYWDTFVHCFFGFLAAATLFYLYPRIKGKDPNLFDAVVVVLIVIAFAAIWELFEYVMGAILDSDMQDVYRLTGDVVNHVLEAKNAGSTADLNTLMKEMPNAVSDTMYDMVVAIVGSLVFFACLYPIRFLKRKRKGKE